MIITSRQNPEVKRFRELIRLGDAEFFAVEGAKLIADALDSGFEIEAAAFTPKAAEKYADIFGRIPCRISVINYDISEYISDTKTPQGAFALFKRRDKRNPLFSECRRLILLDGVRDPGNVGGIARSCEAFGFDGLILSCDSADLFGSKAVRAAAGSAFRLPSVRGDLTAVIPELKQSGFVVYAADLDKEALPLNQVVFAERSAVVIGSEGEGISRAAAGLCDSKIYIPIKGVRSLNAGVAAGIVCYAASGKEV